MSKKIAFYTLGCKVNQYETNAMIQHFKQKGYELVNFHEVADIYIVNTCSVTNMSDKKSRQALRRVKQLNPNSILVVTGCYAQVKKEELKEIKEIDLILGTNEKNKIVEYVEHLLKSASGPQIEVTDVMQEKEYQEFGSITYTENTRAVIKVQDGCDRFCSYCIIPYARGRVRSRNTESILQEVKQIAKKQVKEIVITGIHIASYGKDFKDGTSLIDLLEKLNQIEGIQRIRLGSLEPNLITSEFVKRLVVLEKICPHFHLSLQSGCNETLKRMNRRYTTEEFMQAVTLLRESYPTVLLTTDVIVGFPGETDEEFKKTYDFLKQVNFYKMHVFPYSPRRGTKAANMPNQIEGDKKEQRSKKLIELSHQCQQYYHKSYFGKTVEVLLEEKVGDYYQGHTDNYLLVRAKSQENLENQIQQITIQEGTKEQGNLILQGNVIRL